MQEILNTTATRLSRLNLLPSNSSMPNIESELQNGNLGFAFSRILQVTLQPLPLELLSGVHQAIVSLPFDKYNLEVFTAESLFDSAFGSHRRTRLRQVHRADHSRSAQTCRNQVCFAASRLHQYTRSSGTELAVFVRTPDELDQSAARS